MKKNRSLFDDHGVFVADEKAAKKKKAQSLHTPSQNGLKLAIIAIPIAIIVIIIFVVLFLMIRSGNKDSETLAPTPVPEEVVLIQNDTPTPMPTPTPTQVVTLPPQPVINVSIATATPTPTEEPLVTVEPAVTVKPQQESTGSFEQPQTQAPTPTPMQYDFTYVPDVLVSSYSDVALTDGSVIDGITVVNYINANPDMTFSVYNIYSNESITYVNGGASVGDIPVSATYKVTIMQDSYAFTQVY